MDAKVRYNVKKLREVLKLVQKADAKFNMSIFVDIYEEQVDTPAALHNFLIKHGETDKNICRTTACALGWWAYFNHNDEQICNQVDFGRIAYKQFPGLYDWLFNSGWEAIHYRPCKKYFPSESPLDAVIHRIDILLNAEDTSPFITTNHAPVSMHIDDVVGRNLENLIDLYIRIRTEESEIC